MFINVFKRFCYKNWKNFKFSVLVEIFICHPPYNEGKHICLLVITWVLLGPLLWDFAPEFLPKTLFKWYIEWLCFWASFKRHTKCTFMKILWSFLDEKIPHSPVTGKILSVQWRGHKISFWVINYMPPNQKKGS